MKCFVLLALLSIAVAQEDPIKFDAQITHMFSHLGVLEGECPETLEVTYARCATYPHPDLPDLFRSSYDLGWLSQDDDFTALTPWQQQEGVLSKTFDHEPTPYGLRVTFATDGSGLLVMARVND